eukprot:scaffold252_cov59-Phaeocystis_antarctica.AAC.1
MRTPSSTARRAGRACRWRCLRLGVHPPGGSERRDDSVTMACWLRGGCERGGGPMCRLARETEESGDTVPMKHTLNTPSS